MQQFLSDMDLVFDNCKLYNGLASYVGSMGVKVRNEYLNYLNTYRLSERFPDDNNCKKFVIDESCIDMKNAMTETYLEEISESEMQDDLLKKMNDKNDI